MPWNDTSRHSDLAVGCSMSWTCVSSFRFCWLPSWLLALRRIRQAIQEAAPVVRTATQAAAPAETADRRQPAVPRARRAQSRWVDRSARVGRPPRAEAPRLLGAPRSVGRLRQVAARAAAVQLAAAQWPAAAAQPAAPQRPAAARPPAAAQRKVAALRVAGARRPGAAGSSPVAPRPMQGPRAQVVRPTTVERQAQADPTLAWMRLRMSPRPMRAVAGAPEPEERPEQGEPWPAARA